MRKAIFGIAVVVAAAACGSGSSNVLTAPAGSPAHATTTTTPPKRGTHKQAGTNFHGYPASVVHKFMSSCLKKTSALGCNCVLGYISADHRYKQLKAASIKQLYDWELTAARACATL